MKIKLCKFGLSLFLLCVFFAANIFAEGKQTIKALFIPLADHYAGVLAYDKYRHEMTDADYVIKKMKSWALLRAYFMSGEADIAFIVCPMAMDMFNEKPDFRWVSLLHRDGNALAINDLLNRDVKLSQKRFERKPDGKVADAFTKAKTRIGRPSECAVPSLLSTHTVILYKYLKDHGKTLSLGFGMNNDVLAVEVPPYKSPSFIRKKNNRDTPASFEQSLPWADVVETNGFGRVAWYSKDVMSWENGHVDCIVIATDDCIKNKREALKEVIHYIHRAGIDIEVARREGFQYLLGIANLIRNHMPEHNSEAIVQSLRPDLEVINYLHLNVDKGGLKQIMDYAVEGNILKSPINIDKFADTSFSTKITEEEIVIDQADYRGVTNQMTDTTAGRLKKQIELLEKLTKEELILDSVRKQNEKNMLLEEIKVIDSKWISGGVQKFVMDLMNNSVSLFFQEELLSKEHFYSEAFLCDKNGAVVGEFPKSSDYWQGDEDKFIKCFNKGFGKVFIGEVEYDESTQSNTVQISIPVKDNDETIGVLVVGIRNIK